MAQSDLLIHPTAMPQVVTDPAGLNVRADVLYTNAKGEEKRGLHKSADKLLGKLREPLGRLLEPGEAVFYLCRAQAPLSPLEQFVGGFYVYYQSLVVLVFTNRRMIHLLVDSRGAWRRGLRDVRWGDVSNARVKGVLTRNLELEYRNLEKPTYTRLRYRDAAKLRGILPPLLQASTGELSPMQGMVAHCPDCFGILKPQVYLCPLCGLVFKDEKTLWRRTLLIPGGGYFYTRQWALGIFSAAFETWFTLLLILSILMAAGILPSSANPGQTPGDQAEALDGLIGILMILAVEKLFHGYHSLRVVRDFSPAGRKAAPAHSAAVGGRLDSGTSQGWTIPPA